jgi:putative addiction module component (TIGR02574 family)
MMMTFNEVFDAAQALPASDRIRLMEALWEAVPESDWPPPNEEWIAESQRRSAEYGAGASTVSSWPEVKERARRKAGLDG